jgi:hypothetical protein
MTDKVQYIPTIVGEYACQGECDFEYLGPVSEAAELTKGWTPAPLENGKLIVGHSETGHHHVMERPSTTTLLRKPDSKDPLDALKGLLVVTEEDMAVHLRSNHTHAPVGFKPGVYKLLVSREGAGPKAGNMPEEWRRTLD